MKALVEMKTREMNAHVESRCGVHRNLYEYALGAPAEGAWHGGTGQGPGPV